MKNKNVVITGANAGLGYETARASMFAINHLAYFLLTHALYPNLILAENPRVVSVASDSHFKGKINFDDIHLTKNYHGLKAYAQSKMANIHFMYELKSFLMALLK